MGKGIDYGRGMTNIDHTNGIRYGVLSSHDVLQSWSDESEAEYGEPHCPKCGNEADEPKAFGDSFTDGVPDDYTEEAHECADYVCVHCKHFFGAESAFGDEPIGYFIKGEIDAHQNQGDTDIFITKSPFYTRAAFCSPCAPGACFLASPDASGEKAYCFGPDWFDSENPCPYPVYRVADDVLIYTPSAE